MSKTSDYILVSYTTALVEVSLRANLKATNRIVCVEIFRTISGLLLDFSSDSRIFARYFLVRVFLGFLT